MSMSYLYLPCRVFCTAYDFDTFPLLKGGFQPFRVCEGKLQKKTQFLFIILIKIVAVQSRTECRPWNV
jgi:hypothetical protein